MRGHKEERIEWRDVINKNVERYDVRQKETNEILNKLHIAIDKSI